MFTLDFPALFAEISQFIVGRAYKFSGSDGSSIRPGVPKTILPLISKMGVSLLESSFA